MATLLYSLTSSYALNPIQSTICSCLFLLRFVYWIYLLLLQHAEPINNCLGFDFVVTNLAQVFVDVPSLTLRNR